MQVTIQAGQGSTSFFAKKEAKKLSFALARAADNAHAPDQKKFFASFLQKRSLLHLCTPETKRHDIRPAPTRNTALL
jgi:hypothetical protein